MTQPAVICRMTWETDELVRRWPPQHAHVNKRLLYDVACPPGAHHAGTITSSRWTAGALPADVPPPQSMDIVSRRGFFDYPHHSGGDTTVHWHLNFADAHLFYGYGTSLFAQDELQTAEHPALGSLREALLAGGECAALTEDEQGPTPVLVRGVERRCHIRTDGLYGYRFGTATPDRVRAAVDRLDPPTVSNILAIAAPASGRGAYTTAQVARILLTGRAGFLAARAEAATAVTIHTGFWGCGVFGGNRILMTALQIVAARLAQTERLVFYVGSKGTDADAFEAGRGLADTLLASAPQVPELIAAVVAQRLMWGRGDGN